MFFYLFPIIPKTLLQFKAVLHPMSFLASSKIEFFLELDMPIQQPKWRMIQGYKFCCKRKSSIILVLNAIISQIKMK